MNNSHWSRAMKKAGYKSETMTFGYFARINKATDWDILIEKKFVYIPKPLRPYYAYLYALTKYDVFIISFHGFCLGSTPLWRVEPWFFKLSGKKTIVSPYGSDSYIYNRIRSTPLIHGLLMSYPAAARNQRLISNKVDYWCAHGDVIMPGVMGMDGLGRWDVLFPSALSLDLDEWSKSERNNSANGIDGTVTVAHAPNHRGFKGTEFVNAAVEQLKKEGLDIHYVLIENMQNSEVKSIFEDKVDILVEQLVCTGHGLNAIEGMASGLTVVSNLEDENYLLPMRRWSYFSECPIVSASPESIVDVLRELVVNPDLRKKLNAASRNYVEKFQGEKSTQYLFGEIIDFLFGRRDNLINLFHPILGEYPNKNMNVGNPLINNQIINDGQEENNQ